jgi:sugar phosphate permease
MHVPFGQSTFLYFLIRTATYSATLSADLSTLFDVGGIIGAIVAGVLSDYSGMSALTCAAMLGLACPTVSTHTRYINKFNPLNAPYNQPLAKTAIITSLLRMKYNLALL